MPGTHLDLPQTTPGPAAARSVTRAVVAVCLSALATAGLAGCYGRASASPSIALATAYVAQPSVPGETVGYLVIRNNGGRDRLISARTSVGGKVSFRAPRQPGSTMMHTIPAISIPAHNTVRLIPDALHLLITGAGPMHGGKDITLTLVFAHAGPVSVLAQVTNPQTGGSSYFLN
jgi:copper(I)-binding protein